MTPAVQPEAAVFGQRLRELRQKRGHTLESLADLTGMSFPFISEMERGLKVPSLTTLIRLAVALECKVTDLVSIFNKTDLRSLLPK
jgi:transcriptional regulator with XRE-family HTH domain